jgi:hypothetical protein
MVVLRPAGERGRRDLLCAGACGRGKGLGYGRAHGRTTGGKRKRQCETGATDHAADSVATRSQLGSRLPSWREKVQMSLTSETASALPSMTSPFASRTTLMS